MKPPRILTVPDSFLRHTAQPVIQFNPQLAQTAQTMISRMHQAEGVGLAATQIGLDARLFVYGIDSFTHQGQTVPTVPAQAVVNPVITILDSHTQTMDEGCLSIPGIIAPVARPIRIKLQGQDLQGTPFTKELTGYEARVVQHETDHLNGILFLDHVTDPAKIRRDD